MPGLFKPDDFEVSTAKRTLLYIRHEENAFLTSLKARPRVNPFESIKQDLPSLYMQLHPLEIGHSGIYNFTSMKAAYVNFAYSDQLVTSLHDFSSARVEVKEKIQRPLSIGPLTITPFAGFQGIFYSNSPDKKIKNLAILGYGFDLFARAERQFSNYKHVLEPYAGLSCLTNPTVFPNDHYIFSIADGVQKINQVQIGIKSLLFPKNPQKAGAPFSLDLFANAFFKDATIPQLIPRMYLFLSWNLPSVHFTFQNAWNFRHHLLDFSKARLRWTASENVALSLEGRYRSQFDWRKADHENFILDVTRSETELLLSPLSDQRITLISNLFVRITPLWEAQLSAFTGFYRLTEKPYTEVKIDLSTWVSSSLKVRVSYSHVRNDDRVSFHMDLVKKSL